MFLAFTSNMDINVIWSKRSDKFKRLITSYKSYVWYVLEWCHHAFFNAIFLIDDNFETTFFHGTGSFRRKLCWIVVHHTVGQDKACVHLLDFGLESFGKLKVQWTLCANMYNMRQKTHFADSNRKFWHLSPNIWNLFFNNCIIYIFCNHLYHIRKRMKENIIFQIHDKLRITIYCHTNNAYSIV